MIRAGGIRKETVARHASALPKFAAHFGRGAAGLKGFATAAKTEALCRRYAGHLAAKGIGFMRTGKIPTDVRCRTAAFPNVAANASSARQMRTLDALRDRLLRPFPHTHTRRDGKAAYFGRPFSYYGYLMRENRPAQPIPGKGAAHGDAGALGGARFYAQC